jgi:hypothetical protein
MRQIILLFSAVLVWMPDYTTAWKPRLTMTQWKGYSKKVRFLLVRRSPSSSPA